MLGYDDDARAALASGARTIGESGMCPGSAGNLSVRTGETMLITPSGVELQDTTAHGLVEVAIADGAPVAAAHGKPSSETGLHRAIYAATGGKAIVHTHSSYATVVGTLADELPAIHYAIAAFGGPVRVARYETFGTMDLANAVVDALDGRTAALMANHGAVVVGDSVEQAVAKAFQLEWVAATYYRARVAGEPKILTEEELDAVREQSRTLRYGAGVPTA